MHSNESCGGLQTYRIEYNWYCSSICCLKISSFLLPITLCELEIIIRILSWEMCAHNLYNYGIIPQKCSRFFFSFVRSSDVDVIFRRRCFRRRSFQFSFHSLVFFLLWPPFWHKWSSCQHISITSTPPPPLPLPTYAFFIVFGISLWNCLKNNEKQQCLVERTCFCVVETVSRLVTTPSQLCTDFKCAAHRKTKQNWTVSNTHTHSTDKQLMYVETEREDNDTRKSTNKSARQILFQWCFVTWEFGTAAVRRRQIDVNYTLSYTKIFTHIAALAYFSAVHWRYTKI